MVISGSCGSTCGFLPGEYSKLAGRICGTRSAGGISVQRDARSLR